MRTLELLALLTSLGAAACHSHQTIVRPSLKATDIPLPSGFEYPNGIAAAPDGTLYLGSVTAGTLLRVSPGMTPQVMLEGNQQLFAGTALEFDPKTNLLWVSSPDFLGKEVFGKRVRRPHRVAVVDPERAEVVWSTEVPSGGFVNDIALDGNGGVFLTDSTLDQIWHLAGPGAPFKVHAQSPLLRPGALGPAGIVRLSDGTLVVGLYDDGGLFRITPTGSIMPLKTARPLSNPDGLDVTPDGWLLAIEGSVDTGDGRLVAVDLNAPEPHPVIQLAEGLDTPVNLTTVGSDVVVSESRIRHHMRPKLQLPAPTQWRLLRYTLPAKHRRARNQALAELPADFFPESIAMDAGGRYYVGSATRSEIVRISAEGKAEPWIRSGYPGLMSVQGLLVDDRRLYVCTGNLGKHRTQTLPSALLAFDLTNGSPQGRWTLDAAGFCNDLVALRGGVLLITDTFGGRIWRFDPAGDGKLEIWLTDPRLKGVNGIAVSPNAEAVFVSTFSEGRLLRIERTENGAGEISRLETTRPLDGGDALRMTADGRLVVFENGLVGGRGRIAWGVVEGGRVRLSTIVESVVGPVSGIVDGQTVVWPASNFGRLFTKERSVPYDRSLYRTPLPTP